ncbi:CLUMA_CG009359, isoform A [Clunio marinus]|uniref:CLUMA_CG009359, isoform A n=1 Tax=Clunio marinus TaxID=568069 RepID=A0A1J1IBV1_9DIPT|nr:CLUMA_CG009359, isoform A [Clunio marinus]
MLRIIVIKPPKVESFPINPTNMTGKNHFVKWFLACCVGDSSYFSETLKGQKLVVCFSTELVHLCMKASHNLWERLELTKCDEKQLHHKL